MECMSLGCSSNTVEGELFCHVHVHETAEVDPMECPRGCGKMLYKQDNWENAILWILLSLVPLVLLSGTFTTMVMGIFSCISIIWIGQHQHKQSAVFRFSCNKCEGVLLDNKSLSSIKSHGGITDISEKLMSELDNTIQSSEIKCPGCDVIMARIPISYVLQDKGTGILVIDLIKLSIPNTMNLMELDGCRDCGLVWFDKGEINDIRNSQTLRGESFGESGKGWYREGRESKKAFEGISMKRDDGNPVKTVPMTHREFAYCSVDGCNSLAFRNLEFCHRHK